MASERHKIENMYLFTTLATIEQVGLDVVDDGEQGAASRVGDGVLAISTSNALGQSGCRAFSTTASASQPYYSPLESWIAPRTKRTAEMPLNAIETIPKWRLGGLGVHLPRTLLVLYAAGPSSNRNEKMFRPIM